MIANGMPAYNKRFGKIGGKVITRISVCPLTVGDNPNDVQSSPNFAKPPGRYLQAGESAMDKAECAEKKEKTENVENIVRQEISKFGHIPFNR